MGGAAGPATSLAATGLSLASMGFTMEGDKLKAKGVSEGDIYKAEQMERAAQYGDLKATQVGGQLTRNLGITLGNIDAIRGAARTDPTSPTGAAVRNTVEAVGTEQKDITVNSITAQAREDEANAAYLRHASSEALLSGNIAATGDLLKGLSGAVSGMPGGGGGGSNISGNVAPGFFGSNDPYLGMGS